nr:tRNA (N(6)-L-threonylcarbamoyladenosine(37)-C(2))-methylthiotransferase MtaB [Bacilli bacterium]
RKYLTDDFLSTLKKIREIRPEIAITTDVIAGFALESDEEWEETMRFCSEADFSEIHVFPFSMRKGTAATQYKDTSPEIKEKRVHELLSLSRELRDKYERRFYGRKMEVLFEEYDSIKHLAYGHTSNYLKVALPSDKDLHGQFLDVIYDESTKAD